MNDRLSALKLFTRAARMGNFSSAGRELGLSQPSASRMIAALEKEVGAVLFSRTTRAIALTEAGTRYLSHVEAILAALDEADHEARGTGELRGVLRVGTSSSFVLRGIIPRLPAFLKAHPSLSVDFMVSDRYQDLVTEGIDVAFRFGPLADSSAVARKVTSLSMVLTASPSYLQEHGTPAMPSDLAQHSVITGPSHSSQTITLRKEGRMASVRVESQIAVTLTEGAIASAVAGLGIAASGAPVPEMRSGTLVQVLPDWNAGSIEIHALFVNRKGVKPAARALTDFLVEDFLANEYGV